MTADRHPSAVLDRAGLDRLAAAKLWLITTGDLPYLSSALYGLVTVPSSGVASMSTDPLWRLYVNPAWLAAADVPDIGRCLAHQVWHLLGEHAARAGDLGVTVAAEAHWRTATHVTIGEALPWPDPALPGAVRLGLRAGAAAEEHFAVLSRLAAPAGPAAEPASRSGSRRSPPDGAATDPAGGGHQGAPPAPRPDQTCGSGADGRPRAHDIPPGDPAVPGLTTMQAHALRRAVAVEFRAHHRARGTVPGSWGRWVQDILDPVVPWPQVLHAAVRRGLGWAHGHADYTYSRIARRQSAVPSVVLPALRRPVPSVVVVVDTSGSVDDGLLAQALGEIDAVLAGVATGSQGVTVLAVDAAVHTVARVRDVRDIELAGGGGTDMAAGIGAALAHRPRPHLIIVLTDGFTPWPPTPTPIPVIAALLGRERGELPDTPPWVQRVEVLPETGRRLR